MNKLLLAVAMLLLSLPVYAEIMACPENISGKEEKIDLTANYGLSGEVGIKSENYGFDFGMEHKKLQFCATDNLIASFAVNVYYKFSDVQLTTDRDQTTKYGFGLARAEYNKWTKSDAITPFLALSLENSLTEISNNTGVENYNRGSVFVWGIGIENKLNDYVTLEISHSIRLDNLTHTKLSDETVANIKVNMLPILFPSTQ